MVRTLREGDASAKNTDSTAQGDRWGRVLAYLRRVEHRVGPCAWSSAAVAYHPLYPQREEFVQHLRIHSLLLFGMVVFGGVETAMADVQYSFTTIDVPGA